MRTWSTGLQKVEMYLSVTCCYQTSHQVIQVTYMCAYGKIVVPIVHMCSAASEASAAVHLNVQLRDNTPRNCKFQHAVCSRLSAKHIVQWHAPQLQQLCTASQRFNYGTTPCGEQQSHIARLASNEFMCRRRAILQIQHTYTHAEEKTDQPYVHLDTSPTSI
jgi:hypothetical protein